MRRKKTRNIVNPMGICDICGKNRDTRKADVEGAKLDVCFTCVQGKKESSSRPARKVFKKKTEMPRVNFEFVDDYGEIVKTAREKADITQKDLGVQVNEHSSIIQKIEHGDFKPRIGLAKKLEKKLNIRIIKKIEQLDEKGNVVNNKKDKDSENNRDRKDSKGFRPNGGSRERMVYTLADAIKIKKR